MIGSVYLILGGLACVLVPPYINEIASRNVRGAAGTAFQLALTIGILVAQIIGLPFIAGTCTGWGWGLSIVFLLPLAGLFPLFLLPNSPAQLLVKYDDEAQARADLQKLRGTQNVQGEIDTIRHEARETGSKTETLSLIQVIESHFLHPCVSHVKHPMSCFFRFSNHLATDGPC